MVVRLTRCSPNSLRYPKLPFTCQVGFVRLTRWVYKIGGPGAKPPGKFSAQCSHTQIDSHGSWTHKPTDYEFSEWRSLWCRSRGGISRFRSPMVSRFRLATIMMSRIAIILSHYLCHAAVWVGERGKPLWLSWSIWEKLMIIWRTLSILDTVWTSKTNLLIA